jgi:hypothetical protein
MPGLTRDRFGGQWLLAVVPETAATFITVAPPPPPSCHVVVHCCRFLARRLLLSSCCDHHQQEQHQPPQQHMDKEHQSELDSVPVIEKALISLAVETVTGSSSRVVHDAVPVTEPGGAAGGARLHGRRRVHGVLVVMRQVRLRVVVVHRRQLHRQELWTN